MADDHNTRRANLLPAGQILGAMVVLMGLGFLPPPRGKMFLLPLHAHAPVAALAIMGGARIVTSGPVGGSLVVVGERDRLFLPMLKAGILVMAAPVAGCGERRAAEL
jgi:hypothetical protein